MGGPNSTSPDKIDADYLGSLSGTLSEGVASSPVGSNNGLICIASNIPMRLLITTASCP